MKSKTWFWIVLFAVLAAAGIGVTLLRGGGTVANIYVDGELYRSVNLGAVAAPYDIVVTTQYGTNVVHIERGAVSVAQADCDEQICVNQGKITDGLLPIVCLPHHLVIQIEEP